MKGDDVEQAQRQLSALGFDEVGDADGLFGNDTENAVKAFQASKKMPQTGIIDEEVWKALFPTPEPGYVSDAATPHRVSPGIMQILISTAREALGDDAIDRAWLLEADNAIQAGTAFIARQKSRTGFDPPKVAYAYNAGGVYKNDGEDNRWKMRQYPIGSSKHADRFVAWFNDCFRYFQQENQAPSPSFFEELNAP